MKSKRAFYLLFLIVVVFSGFALMSSRENNNSLRSYVLQWQSSTGTYPEMVNPFENSEVDTVLYLTGTTTDTSVAIPAADIRYLRMNFAATDTAGDDSSNVTYKLYGAATDQFNRRTPPAFSRFAYLGSFTIGYQTTHDTTWAIHGEIAYGPYEYYYVTATGNAGNSLATPSAHVARVIYEKHKN